MPALVESMMYTRTVPWHGLGTKVDEAPTSADALRLAGLDWTVEQKNIQLCGGAKIQNFRANVRSSDGHVLGIVSDRYPCVNKTPILAPALWIYQLFSYPASKLRSGVLKQEIQSDHSTLHELSKKRVQLFEKLDMF